MGVVQIVTTSVAAVITAVAVVLGVRAVRRMLAVIRLGQPDPERFIGKGRRLKAMLTEVVGHTRMLRWGVVGAAHWLVMVSFLVLSLLVLEAYFEVVRPGQGLPLFGGSYCRCATTRTPRRPTCWPTTARRLPSPNGRWSARRPTVG